MGRVKTLPAGKHIAFGRRLQAALDHAGIKGSYERLGREFDVSSTTIGNLLNGHKLPSTELAIKLAKRTGVNIDWLLTERGSISDPMQVAESMDSNVYGVRGSLGKVALIDLSDTAEWCAVVNPYESVKPERHIFTSIEHSDRAFFVRIAGSSMDDGSKEGYPDGCLAQFEPSEKATHDDDVLVQIAKDKIIFRNLQVTDDGKFLVAKNPDFPNRIVEFPSSAKVIAICKGCLIERIKHREKP